MRRIAWIAALALAGCGAPEEEHAEEGHHAHDPVYGGRLVEIGEHFAQVEVVHDPDGGTLTAYIWDGHVEKPIFLSMGAIHVRVDGQDVLLKPVEDAKTGDRPGHASKFVGKAAALEGVSSFRGTIGKLVIRDAEFEEVEFEYGEE